MIGEIVLAVAVATSAPSATATPGVSATAPIREIVYKVTTSLRLDDITESFGGGPDAVAPSSSDHVENHAIVTVDILGKDGDGTLSVKVVEQWQSHLRPISYGAAVAPDGTVAMDPSAMDDVSLELLPYFGVRFAPGDTLSTSSHWSINQGNAKWSISTDYSVTAVSGDTVTVHKVQTIKAWGSSSVDGKIVYEPSMLVPLTGDVEKKLTQMYANGQTGGTLRLHFERVSDTRLPPQ